MKYNKKTAAGVGGPQAKNDSAQLYTGRQDPAANDGIMPAVGGWFRFWKPGAVKDEAWQPVPVEDWPALQQQRQPRYATALEVDTCITDATPQDVVLNAKHRGDFYADWDCSNVAEFGFCINDVNEFLNKLQADYGVKLESLRIYATGGRGFHIEIPWAVFRANSGEAGTALLPQAYREMARQMHGRYMDLAIYSAKRGRMWRQPNVQRENGRYKVPVTLDEMRRMTVEMYEEICKEPRPEPERAAPELAAALVALFDKCHSRVVSAEKKPARRLFKLLELPDTLADVLAGKRLRSDVGFNQLALQLAIAAHALNWQIDELLAQTAELCAGWRGDTHTTPGHCVDELRRMHAYTAENSGYAYSPNAIRALLEDTADTDDLAGEIDLAEVAKAKRPEVVAALAELDPLEFSARRKQIAASMNVGATELAEEVKRLRSKQAAARERDAAEAEAAKAKKNRVQIVAPDAEPWPEPVDGEALLTDVATFIRRYVYADACIIDATALWVAQTYAQDIARYMPIAHVTAPEKRCGKSTMFDTIGMLAYRPLKAACISAAALTRVIQIYRPTLMLDEYDSMGKELKDELRPILNAGHSETAAVSIKLEKVDTIPDTFNFEWCPAVQKGVRTLLPARIRHNPLR